MTTQIWATESVANTDISGAQGKPSIATLEDGSYVVVWQDASGFAEVKGQRYAADGTALGENFMANVVMAGVQYNPSVSALGNGGFTVTWLDNGSIESRTFDSAGTPLANETSFNSVGPITGLVSTGLGEGFGRVDVYVAGGDIYHTRYSIHGLSLGSTVVNMTYGENGSDGLNQWNPDVVELAFGGYVIVWAASNEDNVWFRAYNADGTARTDETVVTSSDFNGNGVPKVTALANGGFVVTWDAQNALGDGNTYDVRARMYNADMAPMGPEFMVNTLTSGIQAYPEVIGTADGGFLALWDDRTVDGIAGQQFDAYGQRIGTTFDVSPASGASAGNDGLSATLLKDGRVAVAWEADNGADFDENVHVGVIDPRGGQVRGGLSAETLYGGGGDDQITALAGDDVVLAGAGEDTVLAGVGADTVDGGKHDDVLYGQAGADLLQGGAGDDELYGGVDADQLRGGLGADLLHGGAGVDTASYVGATKAVQLNLLTGEHGGEATGDVFVAVERFMLTGFSDSMTGGDVAEVIEGGSGADTLKGSGGMDQLKGGFDADKLHGDAGDDHLQGDGHADFLYGGADNDLLQGGEGADRLYGEDGADTLDGGLGAEFLYGGAGADRFVFTSVLDSTFVVSGRDVIKDFSNAEGDIIDLSAIDAVKGGADNAFILVNAFSGVAGQLVAKVSGANTLLTADVDGDKVADFAVLVENVTNLQASDFLL